MEIGTQTSPLSSNLMQRQSSATFMRLMTFWDIYLTYTTLLSGLRRLYLHSLTSHQLPDPLLKCTGTEGAVKGLAKQRRFPSRVFFLKKLRCFGQLTPLRRLHSNQIKSMETAQRNTTLPASTTVLLRSCTRSGITGCPFASSIRTPIFQRRRMKASHLCPIMESKSILGWTL